MRDAIGSSSVPNKPNGLTEKRISLALGRHPIAYSPIFKLAGALFLNQSSNGNTEASMAIFPHYNGKTQQMSTVFHAGKSRVLITASGRHVRPTA